MKWKKLAIFFILLLYFFGTVAGIGYSLYHGEWWVSIGIAAVSALAFQKAKELFDILRP